jgi:hypothetical protein
MFLSLKEIYRYGDKERFQIRAIVDEKYVVIKREDESYGLVRKSWFDDHEDHIILKGNWG